MHRLGDKKRCGQDHSKRSQVISNKRGAWLVRASDETSFYLHLFIVSMIVNRRKG